MVVVSRGEGGGDGGVSKIVVSRGELDRIVAGVTLRQHVGRRAGSPVPAARSGVSGGGGAEAAGAR